MLTRIPLDGVEIIHPGGTVPIPAELGPGDRFHLFFSSDATRDGRSSDITDYNRFVQNVADSASLGSSEGISWFAVASTSTVNARDNAIVTSPVYNTKNYTVTDTDMELVATDSTDMWDGTLLKSVEWDEFGMQVVGDAWTGSLDNGLAASITNGFTINETLGSPSSNGVDPARAWCGRTLSTENTWLHFLAPAQTTLLHLYALSEELQVAVLPFPRDFAWQGNGIGEWNVPGNWNLGQGFPNHPNHTARFADAISRPTTIVTNEPVSVNRIEFDNTSNSYAIGGLGSVNLMANTAPTPFTPTINVQGAHQFQAIVNLHNDTSIDVVSGSKLLFNNILNLMGNTLTKTGGGEIAVRNDLNTDGGTIDVQQGMISGNGTIRGHVNNKGGTLSPGNSDRVKQVTENPVPNGNSTRFLTQDETDAVANHDQRTLKGSVKPDGTLEVDPLNGFQPVIGDRYVLFNFISTIDKFNAITLPQLPTGLAWDMATLPTEGSLTAVPEPAGIVLYLLGFFGVIILVSSRNF